MRLCANTHTHTHFNSVVETFNSLETSEASYLFTAFTVHSQVPFTYLLCIKEIISVHCILVGSYLKRKAESGCLAEGSHDRILFSFSQLQNWFFWKRKIIFWLASHGHSGLVHIAWQTIIIIWLVCCQNSTTCGFFSKQWFSTKSMQPQYLSS